MTDFPPRPIVDARGLTWRRRGNLWEARWRPRADLVARGYPGTPVRLWKGLAPKPADVAWLQSRCEAMQDDMLGWARGAVPVGPTIYDGTLTGLIDCYRTDPDSTYHKLRYGSRKWYNSILTRIARDHGNEALADIKARMVIRWHENWSGGGRVAMGHAMVGMLRTLFGFGVAFLECPDCERLSGTLHKMRFANTPPRKERITAEQAEAIRRTAHQMGLHSVALAQALQFDCILRQKDVVGEWVPLSEPGLSDVVDGNQKWLRGLLWQEIDANLVLRHVTSKRQKEIAVDLRLAPMVMAELQLIERRASGPVIICETRGRPYSGKEFRQAWRKVARAAGVPDAVYNMDSRAGAISEATDAGAELEHVRHAATHSNISMTQRYSRGGEEKTAKVMAIRAEHRKNKEQKP